MEPLNVIVSWVPGPSGDLPMNMDEGNCGVSCACAMGVAMLGFDWLRACPNWKLTSILSGEKLL